LRRLITPNENPYAKDEWKHNEWWLGWSQEEECDGESWDWETDSFLVKTDEKNNGE